MAKRKIFSILFFWAIICVGLAGTTTFVRTELGPRDDWKKPEPEPELTIRDSIAKLAREQIGVRQTNSNTGPEIDEYLACSGLDPGYAWCAAMMCWLHSNVDRPYPEGSAWSPNWFPESRVTEDLEKGNVFGIYFRNLGRIAHVGMIVEDRDNSVVSVEGNTSDTGGREGDGVYKKYRSKSQIYKVSNWVE